MPALTTTQEFLHNYNMVQGSLSFLTINIKNLNDGSKLTHKYWKNDVTAHATAANVPNLIAGDEYTVKTIPAGNTATAADWAAIGLRKSTYDAATKTYTQQVPVKGDKFIAAAEGVGPGGPIPFGATFATAGNVAVLEIDNTQNALQAIVQGVQSRASIVYIGHADDSTKGAGAGSVRIILENRGYQGMDGVEERFGTSANQEELEKMLNDQVGIHGTTHGMNDAAKVFVVTEFTY